ncbi:MAG TPA: hypothetical protein VFV19_13140 [Candidatus Polarisedimenticolaceae bacterium]|nr:hypothetical protein [Candidatus Polarisedimenticolaceae bacterium]
MEWIDAIGLLQYVEQNLGDQQAIASVAKSFAQVVLDMQQRGIAHGDLQHGNILVTKDASIRLVDYDGMFVPELAAVGPSGERGHRNYQSPKRGVQQFDATLDRFSAWVIYGSLAVIAAAPSMWLLNRHSGSESLMFAEGDFEDPTHSPLVAQLRGSSEATLSAAGDLIKRIAQLSPTQLPAFDPEQIGLDLETIKRLPNLDASARRNIPDWMRTQAPLSGAAGSQYTEGDGWIQTHLPPLPAAAFQDGALIRIWNAVCLAGVLALSALFRFGTLPGRSAAVGVAGLLALGGSVTWAVFRRHPLVVAKRGLASKARALRADKTKTEQRIASIQAEVSKRQAAFAERRSTLERESGAAERRIREQLQQQTTGLETRLKQLRDQAANLAGALRTEIAQATAAADQAAVDRELQAHWIAGANIHGLGNELKSRLAASGIRTAGDFRSVSIRAAGRAHRTPISDLVLPNGRRIHVYGLGPQKLQALSQWRGALEAAVRHKVVLGLPQHQRMAIEQAHAAKQRPIGEEITRIETQRVSLERAARSASVDQKAQIGTQIVAAQQECELAVRQLESSRDALVPLLQQSSSQLVRLTRDLDTYSAVTAGRFLRFVVMGK